MSNVMTMPGKCGDALLQWPVAYQYGKQTGNDFEVWLDEGTCKGLVPLFEAQPHVSAVKLIGGIVGYECGGQPWHFDLATKDLEGHTVYHLGLRGFPQRQITMETALSSKVPINAKTDLGEPSIWIPHDAKEVLINPIYGVSGQTITDAELYTRPGKFVSVNGKANRLLLHGQGICPHSQSTPTFWRFLHAVMPELEKLFDELVFVGSDDDLEVATTAYPDLKAFSDGGNLLTLASYMADSRAFIGCGSMPVVLASCVGIPAIRVHDPVGQDAPKVIWNNLGKNQLNDTLIGLRTSWPKWRDEALSGNGIEPEVKQV